MKAFTQKPEYSEFDPSVSIDITEDQLHDYLNSWSEGTQQLKQELGEVVTMKIAATGLEKPYFLINYGNNNITKTTAKELKKEQDNRIENALPDLIRAKELTLKKE